MDLKELLGEDLHTQVIAKLGDKKVMLDDGNFIPKSRFDEVIEQKNTYKTQVDTVNSQLEDLKKKNKDNTELQTQITDWQTKYNQAEGKVKEISLNSAIKLSSIKAGANDPTDILLMLDKSKFEIDESGNVKGLEEQLTALKASKSYLFTAIDPNGTGGSKGNGGKAKDSLDVVTKEQFAKMTYKDRMNLYSTNPVLYQELQK